MPPILTQKEWMIRVLIDHFHLHSTKEPYREIFIRCFKEQQLPGCVQHPIQDHWEYLHGSGCVPAYVQAVFYELCPWNRPAEDVQKNIEEEPLSLAAE